MKTPTARPDTAPARPTPTLVPSSEPVQLGDAQFSLFTVNPRFFRQDVSFSLSTPARVRVRIAQPGDTRHVRTMDLGVRPSGTIDVEWDGRDNAHRLVPEGAYSYTITATNARGERRTASYTMLAVTFTRLVIPLSVVLTSLFNLVLNLIVVLVFIFAFGVSPSWTWLLFPVWLLILMGITLAVSMIVSALYPRFRDIAIIWTVISTALFYATPLLYPAETLAPHRLLSHLITLNPLTPIFLLARKWFIQPSAPGPAAVAGGDLLLLVPLALYIAICVFAFWIFNREAPRIAEEL